MKTKESKPLPTKLTDIKDDHGTSLQAYAESLLEKADAAGLYVFFSFLNVDGSLFHTMSNIVIYDQPDFLHRIAAQMKKSPKSQQQLVPTQVQTTSTEN